MFFSNDAFVLNKRIQIDTLPLIKKYIIIKKNKLKTALKIYTWKIACCTLELYSAV